jgi:hypothetical protein
MTHFTIANPAGPAQSDHELTIAINRLREEGRP